MSYFENGGAPFTMPVAPYGGNGNGFLGGDGAWWLIILLLFFNNGWGNGNGNGMNSGVGNEVQRGFDQSAIMGGFNNITALLNSLAMSMQNCCCENRAGIADLKYTVATEACADRQAVNDIGRDILVAGGNNTQRLIDAFSAKIDGVMGKICQLELDAKNAQIQELQAQLNDSNRRAESRDEIAQILAGQRSIANEVEQYLNPTPRPAWIVQNPNCCSQNFGCGSCG